jgi:hypothetical protein
MNWYNFIRPHEAFGIERLETPAVIFYQRLPKREVIMDSSLLENIGGENDLQIKHSLEEAKLSFVL